MEKIRIIVVDDHKIVRDGIRAMLLGNPDIQLVAEASGGSQLNDLIEKTRPHIVIMDISLPGISGIDLVKEISHTYPLIRVIMLTANTDEDAISASVRAGAAGFLSKDTSREEFIRAVQLVNNGEEYYGEGIARTIFKIFSRNLKSGDKKLKTNLNDLTDREIEIIRLFADGLSFKQIADKLFISPRTVETHKNNVLEKLNLGNTIELVKYAIRQGIVNL